MFWDKKPDTPQSLGKALVKEASRKDCDLQKARALLEAGASLTEMKGGRTALSWAAQRGHAALLEALIAKGADVHAMDKYNMMTALHWAAHDNQPACIAPLLKAKAEVDVYDGTACTPLYLTADNGYLGVAHLLLAAGANPDKMCRAPYTPLTRARSLGHDAVAECMAKFVQKKREAAKAAAALPAPELPPENTWVREGDCAVRIQTVAAARLRVTEVFNFAARERVATYLDLNTKTPAAPQVTPFAAVAPALLAEAVDAFLAQGGAVDVEEILGPQPKKPVLRRG